LFGGLGCRCLSFAFGDMVVILHKHGRSIASLLLAPTSLVVWCQLGLVRWGTRPWSIDAPHADKQPICQALLRADVGAKVLAALAFVLAVVALWQSRTRFAKIALAVTILVLLIFICAMIRTAPNQDRWSQCRGAPVSGLFQSTVTGGAPAMAQLSRWPKYRGLLYTSLRRFGVYRVMNLNVNLKRVGSSPGSLLP